MIYIGIKLTLQNNLLLLIKVFRHNKLLFLLRIVIAILGSISTVLTIIMPMYLKDIDTETIFDALDKVGMKSKVEGLKHSLDTPITSQLHADGVELSGGEAQKLAVARIYASNPQTFIMDEPTSNLDPYAEYQLYNRLMQDSSRDSITIVISHRLTLTYKMSKIIVMEKGAIAEQGTHNQLMENEGIYFEMYNIQAEKYTENTKI